MARLPFWPMASTATIRSLLATPSSFARSITFSRAATAPLPPHLVVESLVLLERLLLQRVPRSGRTQDARRTRRGGLTGPLERVRQLPGPQRLVHALGVATHVRPSARRPSPFIYRHSPV